MGLSVQNLSVSINGQAVLKEISFTVPCGQVHAIMGPNGAGKSSLAKVLAGHPEYEVTQGEIFVNDINFTSLSPEERSLAGLFIGYQHPVEVPGVKTYAFLRMLLQCHRKYQNKPPLSEEEVQQTIQSAAQKLSMHNFLDRDLHVGFSGGERKKNECLQMRLLDPSAIVLDEPDSGVDVDGVKLIGEEIFRMKPHKAICVITHYPKIFRYTHPDIIHVMLNGRIVLSDSALLAEKIENCGYDWLS